MTDRLQIEQLVRELHMARLEGDLERLCALYADEARLRIAGSTDGKPIAIAAIGIAEIRPWLSILVKTFRLLRMSSSLAADATSTRGPYRPPTREDNAMTNGR